MLDMFVVVGIPCWPLHAGYSSPLSTHRHQYSQRRTARYISNGGYDRPCYKESHRRARRICEPGQDGSRRPVLSFVRQQIHATDNLALQHLFPCFTAYLLHRVLNKPISLVAHPVRKLQAADFRPEAVLDDPERRGRTGCSNGVGDSDRHVEVNIEQM